MDNFDCNVGHCFLVVKIFEVTSFSVQLIKKMFFVTGLDWTELTQNIFVTQQIQPCVLSLGCAPIFETQEKKRRI